MANVEQRQYDPVEAIVESVPKGVGQALRIGYVGAKPVGEVFVDYGYMWLRHIGREHRRFAQLLSIVYFSLVENPKRRERVGLSRSAE